MPLTVPTSNLAGGRAAEVRIAQPDTGTTFAQFGDAMAQIGTRLEDDRLAREAQRLDIDMTRDLGQLRLEFEQTNDPDAIDRDWPARLAQLKQQYLTGTDANGIPRVDRKNRDRFDMAFTSLADSHAYELGSRAIQLRRAQADALWIEQSNELVVQGAVAGDAVLDELLAQGEASIDARAARFGTDAATVQQQKMDFRASIYNQRADMLIASDPQGFLTQAEAGTFDVLGEDLTAKKLAAQAQIDKLAALDIKAGEASAREAVALRDERVKAIGDIWKQGRVPADAAYLYTPEARESPYWAAAMARAALEAELPAVKQMTPDELDAAIAAEEARPITEDWESERLTVLRGWRDQAAAKWNTAPVETARAAGMAVPEVRPFDPATPQQFVDDLAQAVRFQDAVLHQGGYTTAPAVFDQERKAELTALLAPAADPAAKQALLSAIVVGAGPQAQAVLDQLGAAPELRAAARYLATNPAAYGPLVKDAVAGQQKVALRTVTLPSERVAIQLFNAATGGALAGLSAAKQREALDLALVLYANEAEGVDPDEADAGLTAWLSDPARVELFSRASVRASGAIGTAGGVQTVRVGKPDLFAGVSPTEYTVSLPPDLTADQASAALTAVNLSLNGLTRDPAREANRYEAGKAAGLGFAMTALQRASVDEKGRPDGRVPDLGSDPAAYFAGLRILRLGETDIYRLVDLSSGRPVPVPDADGNEYRFKLRDLIRHTKGGPK